MKILETLQNEFNFLGEEKLSGHSALKIIEKVFKEAEAEQLRLHDVGCSKRINLMVYEDNTRCYKLTNKELKIYTDNNQIEKGDKHYKCELIKKY